MRAIRGTWHGVIVALSAKLANIPIIVINEETFQLEGLPSRC